MNRWCKRGAGLRTMVAVLVVAAAVAAATAATAQGQAKITTKKYRLSDFTDRVTKVVLSGNGMTDSALKQGVAEYWTASPFEFCSREEFESLRSAPKYYFLLIAEGTGGNAGMHFLTLVKGGPSEKAKNAKGLEGLMEVVSIPCGADGSLGRGMMYLPALLNAVQEYTLQAMEREMGGYSGLSLFNANYARDGRIKRICLAREDIAPTVGEGQLERLDEDILLVTAEEADEQFTRGTFNTLVSLVIAPEEPEPGALCYKMLLDAENQRLYYFKSHKITAREPRGFLPQDLRSLSKGR